MYCVGCIVGPQLWQAVDAPRYTKGCITSVVSWCCLIISFLTFYFTGRRSNAKRDREAEANGWDKSEPVGVEIDDDHTERQDKWFRYTL
jgi:hypothetical protein